MVSFHYENGMLVLLFGGPMTAIVFFWLSLISTLVVFGVDIHQKKRKKLQ